MDSEQQIKLQQEIIEHLKAYIQAQETRMAEKDATIAGLRKLVDELQSLKANLEETLYELRRQFFGVRSEKTPSPDKDKAEKKPQAEPQTIQVRSHTRQRKPKAKRGDIYADLPVRKIEIPLTEEQRRCEYCNSPMVTMGYTEVREELRITPAKVERIKYMQEVAICPECRKDGDGTIVKAKTPAALMPHSPASPSAVAYIIFDKTFMGLPYYRQESGLKQLGLTLPRETMANWYIYCAEEYFLPIYEQMHVHLIKRDVLHADETTCQVLREEGKTPESTSYMWIYLTGSDGLPPIVMYDYQPGRGGKHPKAFLEGFSGLLQCDGYQGYNAVEDVILVCCLAHARRKFFEAVPAGRRKSLKLLDIRSDGRIPEPVLPKEADVPNMIPAEVGVAYCNKLFSIERELRDLPADERKAKRLEKEPPIWEQFWKWLGTVMPIGGSKLEKAVNYAFNHKETLKEHCSGLIDVENITPEKHDALPI